MQKAKSCLCRVLNTRPLAEDQHALTAMPTALLNLQYSYSICLFLYLQDVRRGTRRATRAGHDVASMDLGLPGPGLGSPARASGQDSDVTVVLVLTGRQF